MPNASSKTGDDLDKLTGELSRDEYLRQRLRPRRRDHAYLCLTDVLNEVSSFAGQAKGSVFDYGCGGAPYELLFQQATRYVRADILPGSRVQVLLNQDGSTGEADSSHDFVLSSQVLEHVPDPQAYLRECFRILKPGGELLVTTHGLFEEHACPHDYHRWTAIGLQRAASQAGFEIVCCHKLTASQRGAIQWLHLLVETLRLPRRDFVFYALAVFRKLYYWIARPGLNWLGSCFPGQGVLPADDPASVYIGVSVWARKPRLTISAAGQGRLPGLSTPGI
jgi:SAM-dependent methyltransferase